MILWFAPYHVAAADTEFITIWQTTADNESITIPTHNESTYNYTVDWGDSSTSVGLTGDATHQYAVAGDYRVSITGDFPRIYFNGAVDNEKIISIEQWGNIAWSSMESAFAGCINLRYNATDRPDLSSVTSTARMFRDADFFNGNIGLWDVSMVTDMSGMFSGAAEFNGDISGWTVSQVTDMSNMFDSATFFNQDLNGWDVSQVTDMSGMFLEAEEFNGDISDWEVGQVTDMSSMFDSATFFNQDLNLWNVSSVTDTSGMFLFATEFNSDISGWDVGQVTDMSGMFDSAESFNQNLNNWDVSQVTDMSGMFFFAISFNQDLNNWKVGQVTDMNNMFYGADEFNGNISQWNVGQVTDMSGMFFSAFSFNQNLNLWDVSSVTDMSSMFFGATEFNGDISQWDVGEVTTMTDMFLDVTLSTENYDALLVGWSTIDDDESSLRYSVNFNAGSSRYCNRAARNILTGTYSWMITDGSRDTAGNCLIPFVATGIANQDIFAGTEFSYTFPEDAFHSPRNDTLTYTVNQSPPVAWLNFDADTRTFSGAPAAADIGVVTITVTATDSNGNIAEDTFILTIVSNQPPVVAEGLAPQTAIVGKLFEYPIPDGAFSDPDGGSLSYTATGQPGWLDFSTINNTFSGTPTSTNDIGISTITVTAADGVGSTTKDTFVITVAVPSPFITIWQTTAGNESITIPTHSESIYNYNVDWGDSNTSVGQTGDATHSYAVAGTYRVSITGDFPRIYFNGAGDNEKIISIEQWGNIAWSSMEDAFAGCINLRYNATDRPDLSSVTSTARMFRDADVFNGDIGDWIVSAVTDMSGMFDFAASFNRDLNDWDVSQVTDMRGMFLDAAVFNGDISDWDVGQVTNMSDMFLFAAEFNGDISGWDVGQVTDMSGMFDSAESFNQNLNDWDVSQVTNMRGMFVDAVNFNGEISGWDVSQVTDMGIMFLGVTLSTENYDALLSGWSTIDNDESSLRSMVNFHAGNSQFCNQAAINILTGTYGWNIDDDGRSDYCEAFITIWRTTAANESITIPTHSESTYNYSVDWGDNNISDGQTGDATHRYAIAGTHRVSITGDFPRIYFGGVGDSRNKIISIEQWGNIAWSSMEDAFAGCTNLRYNNAADMPDLSSVTSTAGMFRDAAAFNGDIGLWDVSAITDMSGMFESATSFNQNLNDWDVRQVTDMSDMFLLASDFNGDISDWNVGQVTDMSGMFVDATAFNGDISEWKVGQVTNMSDMFLFATEFNGEISGWDVSQVADMSGMFDSAESFNQNLNGWDVSQVTNMRGMFADATAFNGEISRWDVGRVADMGIMFLNITLSTENYDALLSGWSTIDNDELALQSSVSFHAGNSQFCNTKAKSALVNIPNDWTITDGGQADNCPRDTETFITTWRTTSDKESITIPTHSESTYNYSVDWGDGQFNSAYTGDATHSYAVAGTYTVSITGDFPRIYFDNFGDDRNKIVSIEQWGPNAWKSMDSAFEGCVNLRYNAVDLPDLSSVTSTARMFRNAVVFNGDVSLWDVSSITDMNSMFDSARSFNQDLSRWDVSNVADMRGMFVGVKLSNENYDALLAGWSQLSLQANVRLSAGLSQYCNIGPRNILTNSPNNWIINDSAASDESCGRPYVITAAPDLTVTVGTDFSYTFPEGTFGNISTNTLTYTVNTLPTWLRFSSSTRTFFGTPALDDIGVISITITVTDHLGDTAADTFRLTVPNLPLTVEKELVNQSAVINTPFSYSIDGAFSDPDGGPLSYAATGQPDWLDFSKETRIFSGTPTSTEHIDISMIMVAVTDYFGVISTYNFTLTVVQVNTPTTLTMTLENHTAYVGELFMYAIEGFFSDPDDGPLSYTLAGQPGWLSLTNEKFSGTPGSTNDIGISTVTITATDQFNSSASGTFTITVPNRPPVVAAGLTPQTAAVGNFFEYRIPDDAFSDPDGGRLSYTATGQPDWLNFSTETGIFSGTPTSTEHIDINTITVTVTDLNDGSLVSNFTITVPNRPPVVAEGLTPQTATVGNFFEYRIPDDAFSDPDGGRLSYTATGQPDWLNFSTETGIFSGTPTSTEHIDINTITVTVTDLNGGSLVSNFTITVPNRPPVVAEGLTPQTATVGNFFEYRIPDDAFSDPDGGRLSYTATGQPDWLNFSTETGIFSGTPTSTEHIDINTITVTVTDLNGGSLVSNFTLTVPNRPPVVAEGLTPQTATVGNFFEYRIPDDAFSDPDGGRLSYTATEQIGWLNFSTISNTFSGTPTSTEHIDINTITVTVTDLNGGSLVSNFTLTVPNRPPTAMAGLTPQTAAVGNFFEYRIPDDAFSDPDGGRLSYTATGQPVWLDFPTIDNTFSGTPTSTNHIGIRTVTVTATDQFNSSASDTFTLTVPNRPPVVAEGLTSQTATVGNFFEYRIPDDAFSDPDGGRLSYTATGQPDWLNFSTETGIFSGTPTSTEHIDINTITVTVTDLNGGSLVSNFTITVPNRPPVVAEGLTPQTATVGNFFEYPIPDDAFSDPDGGLLSYTATEQIGWLNFSTISNTFSGTPTSTEHIGIRTVTVTATDQFNSSASDTFTITVPNRPPVVAEGLTSQTATFGKLFEYPIPDDAFSDTDIEYGDTLTYTAEIPEMHWLTFYTINNRFSGTPTSTNHIGISTITVTATDQLNSSASAIFTITVPNRPPVVAEELVNQSAVINTPFSYSIDGTFSDPDDGTLRYTATGQPRWLDFSTINNTFSGTPTSTNHIGISTITVTVTDLNDGSLVSTFTITVPNRPPVSAGLVNQSAVIDILFSYSIEGTFSDPDGGLLSYTATEQIGWLDFSTINNTFSGTPTSSTNDVGISTITVTVADHLGAMSTDNFTLTVVQVNTPTTLTMALEDRTAYVGELFMYAIEGFFSDPDGGPLSYTATEQIGWLDFSTINNTFSGTPTRADDIGISTVTVTATDQLNSSASDTFTITVPNRPPVVAAGLTSQTATVGNFFEYPILDDAFSDPDDGPLSYTATGQPSWLGFSTMNNTFSGTPQTEHVDTTAVITVTATDSGDLKVSASFDLLVLSGNLILKIKAFLEGAQ